MSKKYIITENDVVDNVTSSTTDRPLSAKQGKTLSDTLSGHTGNTENPHNVTSKQLGLGIVVKTFAELKEALMTAQDVPVVLGNDIVVTERIEVVSNILSMNGYAITSDGEGYGFLRIGGGGGQTFTLYGNGLIYGFTCGGHAVFYVESSSVFNLYDTTIYNCTTTYSGAAVNTDGTFNMYSGIIRECNNLSETYSGGGLTVGGTFNMYGGEIVNCKSNGPGGGVFITNNGVFNHYGGTVHGCLSKGRGGGVAGSHYNPNNTYSKYHVSGNAVIENNYSLETPSHENNIFIFGRSVVGAYDGLTVAGNYTGHCGIYMTEAEENMRFGTALDNATLFSKNITCDNKNLKAAVGDETTTAGEKELVWVAV